MIHYTLLPDKEIKSLKKEYRTRLFIVAAFFISCGILVGIGSLIPAYIFSYTQEKEALRSLQTLQENRKERGTDVVITDLASAQVLMDELKKHQDNTEFSQIISEIILRKPTQVSVNSFQLGLSKETASSSLDVIVQGKALTRDSLVNFKKSLEQNPLISKIDLPISDLAKSKDISFTLKLIILTP
ncbi:MAG: hypothetical protein QG640_649 [Patescibacteria group bacterium]|nr:hypothetical protein [Patescibacteria group bacterium]